MLRSRPKISRRAVGCPRSAPGWLVAATDWCTHQVGLAVTPVRGLKNPERAAITALAPDRVIDNREENRKLDVTRLREAALATRVTVLGARLARCPRVGKKQIGRPRRFHVVIAERQRWLPPHHEQPSLAWVCQLNGLVALSEPIIKAEACEVRARAHRRACAARNEKCATTGG
jgi:hypothetical protein